MKQKKTVTDAVRAANQANAQSSTGPKTDRGKAHSRNNALRHGILARNVVLDCERMVVRAVAGKDQRNSNTTLSPGVFQGQVIPAVRSSQNSNRQEGDHLEIEAVMGSALENLTRYQTKLKRDLYRAIETLHKMQAERRKAKADAHHAAAREQPKISPEDGN